MNITIIGLGLIGGSIGMALKKTPGKYRITGFARRSVTGYQAIKLGAIDIFEGDLRQAISDADLVIIATPILAIREIFIELSGSLKKGCIVSDTGSTKKDIMSWAKKLLPRKVDFIGGHPMAGKEKPGIEYAEAGLFKGCAYCLTPGIYASQSSSNTMQEMVKDLGANPVLMEAGEHDRFIAAISHVPFIVSCALFSFVRASEDWQKMKALASSGFRDGTRLASGDPAMYHDICLTNQKNIKLWLKAFRTSLQSLESKLGKEDEELLTAFYKIKVARDEWLEKMTNT